MSDALISPAVGGTMWAATAVTTAYCAHRVKHEADQGRIPLMGVAGAFVFAAQMVNFTIPGTGSSGHLGGGLLLAVLLGPEAAFLVMASVLAVQALFFADGGLLALGANIFNLGFFPAFVAFPLVYRVIAGSARSRTRLLAGSSAGALVAVTAGALAVVLQTTASGVSELPFSGFVAAMLPIHFAIGLVEGAVTAGVVGFVRRAQPEILDVAGDRRALSVHALRTVLAGLAAAALVAGGLLSWFASERPDGLEWSIARVTGGQEIAEPADRAKDVAAGLQERTAVLPDYGFSAAAGEKPGLATARAGTSVSGLVGAAVTLLVALGTGALLTRRASRRRSAPPNGGGPAS